METTKKFTLDFYFGYSRPVFTQDLEVAKKAAVTAGNNLGHYAPVNLLDENLKIIGRACYSPEGYYYRDEPAPSLAHK